jgi:hypothetical protein
MLTQPSLAGSGAELGKMYTNKGSTMNVMISFEYLNLFLRNVQIIHGNVPQSDLRGMLLFSCL